MKNNIVFLSLASMVAAASAQAAAPRIVFSGKGQTVTRACEGGSVLVNGAAQTITLTGECVRVTVNGLGNTVLLEAAGRVVIQGQDNTVRYQRGLRGAARPRITLAGINNTATRREGAARVAAGAGATARATAGAAPATGNRIIFADSDARVTRACHGHDVEVAGSRSVLTLTGECGVVSVTGSANQVDLEAAREINVTGSLNTVRWARPLEGDGPRVSTLGIDNLVSRTP